MFETWDKLPKYIKWMVVIWLFSPLIFYIILPRITNLLSMRRRRNNRKYIENRTLQNEIVIIVLGDLGHSPRMLNHTFSFLKRGYFVQLCGYLSSNHGALELPRFMTNGNELDEDLVDNLMTNEIKVIKNDLGLPYVLFGLLKIIRQCYELGLLLLDVVNDNTKYILIQNPPSLPILLIICMMKPLFFPQIQLIIDWHNLNYTILNLRFQNLNHPIVRLMKKYEQYLSLHYSSLNLVVTSQMGDFLHAEFKIPRDKIVVLYDKPSDAFKPLLDNDERLDIIRENPTVFDDKLNYNPQTDKLVVSSTSFTPDEDFGILIDSLLQLDSRVSKVNSGKNRLVVIITGKGPLQNHYQSIIDSNKWTNVVIKIVWLPLWEYPRILRIADLGISLHYSSSGLDLPMKIVDLFGSGIPVISLNFKCIGELVHHGEDGIVLKENKPEYLCESLLDLLINDGSDKLYHLRENAIVQSHRRWDDEWDTKLGQLVKIKRRK